MNRTIICPKCEKRYEIDESRIPEKGGKITCRQCGYRIVVKKEKPKETAVMFSVECPKCGHPFEFSPPDDEDEDVVNRKTILLVKDEAFFSNFVKKILRKRYRVITASTVEDAYDILTGNVIDLILLDLDLGNGDGKELLRKMKKKCPAIVFSSHDRLETNKKIWNELRKLGADGVIYKGMNLEEELFSKIEHFLS